MFLQLSHIPPTMGFTNKGNFTSHYDSENFVSRHHRNNNMSPGNIGGGSEGPTSGVGGPRSIPEFKVPGIEDEPEERKADDGETSSFTYGRALRESPRENYF